MKIDMVSLDSEKIGLVELSDQIFGCPPRADILQRMVRYQLASRQAGTSQAKTRAMVRGTTRKFMRQKGSGGARHGTRKVNIFRGGGVAHGPLPRDYAYPLPKKIKRLALRLALSSHALGKSLIILDKAEADQPKTAPLRKQFNKLGLTSALIVDDKVEKNFALSMRNIPNINMLPVKGINVYDILRYDQLILTQSALTQIEDRLK